jgi:signal transduction histidine kinase
MTRRGGSAGSTSQAVGAGAGLADQVGSALRAQRREMQAEMHDALGHFLTVIAVQSAAARTALDRSLDEARASLETVQAAAREALDELRNLLVDPAPTGLRLTELDPMVDRVRGAGLDVTVSTEGAPGELDPQVERAAYRIIQEALTNGMRHAHGGVASVAVAYRHEAVSVRVATSAGEDAQAPAGQPARAGSGLGLEDMRIRATQVGGTLTTKRDDDSFTVAAWLPSGAAVPVW